MFAAVTLLTPGLLHTVCTPLFILQSLKGSIPVTPLFRAAQRGGEDFVRSSYRGEISSLFLLLSAPSRFAGRNEGAQVFGLNYLLAAVFSWWARRLC
jgi:hypothetical protein